MLSDEVIETIRTLAGRQVSHRQIAKALKIGRSTVDKILKLGGSKPERVVKPSALDEHAQLILELYAACRRNRVRVHEELAAQGIEVGYTTLTQWCRQHGVGKKPKKPAGEYHFEPGEEMQHDTSPHRVVLSGQEHLLQCASVVVCHSHMLYAQVFWRWNRLQVKIFLSEAVQALGGAAGKCMLDNSTVIMIHGTGPDAVPAPEMAEFSKRFGFDFVAHEKGDANRSARVERPFDFIEKNFYSGRTFADLADCNRQFREWCTKQNGRMIRDLQARPIDLHAFELAHLQPLPVHVPEVYGYEMRVVDVQGYVVLHTNRYSVPARLLEKQVEVREYKDRVVVLYEGKVAAEHALWPPGCRHRERNPAHREPGAPSARAQRRLPVPEERRLRTADPALDGYVAGLRKHRVGRAIAALRRLERLWEEYPAQAVLGAVAEAEQYGMYDLGRLEKMILRRVAGDFFKLGHGGGDDEA